MLYAKSVFIQFQWIKVLGAITNATRLRSPPKPLATEDRLNDADLPISSNSEPNDEQVEQEDDPETEVVFQFPEKLSTDLFENLSDNLPTEGAAVQDD